MVGSTLNGFGSNVSDVDMCLHVRDTSNVDQRNEAIYRLGQIMGCLRRSGWSKFDFKLPKYLFTVINWYF